MPSMTIMATSLSHATTAGSESADLTASLAESLASARPRLVRLARLRGMSGEEAEDIAQETLLTAWRSPERLRDQDRLDAWLDGICRNLCRRLAHARDTERQWTPLRQALDGDASDRDERAKAGGLVDTLAAADGDPLDDLSRRDLARLVESALGHLNAAMREAVELRYLAEAPTDEAAARLGLSVNALETRLSRARKQLRAALNGPLREHAVEFGLALAPADEAGWRDSRLWCHFCGQARLQGILEDAPDGGGRLALRCPRCWNAHGVVETDIPSHPSLQGVKTFRPAFKRLKQIVMEAFAPALAGKTPCFICGAPISACVALGSEAREVSALVKALPDRHFVVAHCPRCGLAGTGAAMIAARGHSEAQRFMREHERWIFERDARVNYQGAPAIRFTLHDLASGDRLSYLADPETLAPRAVILD